MNNQNRFDAEVMDELEQLESQLATMTRERDDLLLENKILIEEFKEAQLEHGRYERNQLFPMEKEIEGFAASHESDNKLKEENYGQLR